jgi:hypothetical protein
LDKYVAREDYQMINMDTDSSYVALSGPFNRLIRPDLREQFLSEYNKWYVQPYCPEHETEFRDCFRMAKEFQQRDCCRQYQLWDSRTPGKFKVEFQGSVICALNAKTYICHKSSSEHTPAATKLSSKGLSKKTNKLTVDDYLHVLRSKKKLCGLNTGFIRKSNKTYTYSQVKTGLTYFYCKRKVLPDGVSTTHLDI